jgi:hypothetical protein
MARVRIYKNKGEIVRKKKDERKIRGIRNNVEAESFDTNIALQNSNALPFDEEE